jgi:hypothetical protein
VNGIIRVIFKIYDDGFLDQIWHLYKIFTSSRGIDIPQITYGHTGFQDLKVAFNDLNNPYKPAYDSFCLILENSVIKSSEYITKEFVKRNGKIYYLDNQIDLNIYHIYDINDGFYRDHCLKDLKDQFMSSVINVESQFLLNNFSSSKTYNLLMMDEYHKTHKDIIQKYSLKELLGSPGSFTRSLCIANEKGLTKYRSSVDPMNIDLGILEKQTISQVPIIDLYKSSSMLRLNHFEYITLCKISNDEYLDCRDFENVNSMISKLGLVASASLLVTFKEIVKNFDGSVLLKIRWKLLIVLSNLFILP